MRTWLDGFWKNLDGQNNFFSILPQPPEIVGAQEIKNRKWNIALHKNDLYLYNFVGLN